MSFNDNEKQLDEQLLKKLKIALMIHEKQNVKTKKKSDSEMVETLRKIIMSEVDRNVN